MPWVRIDLSAGRSEEQKQKTAEAVTAAIAEHCGCPPDSVSIVFNDVADGDWAFGGVLRSRLRNG